MLYARSQFILLLTAAALLCSGLPGCAQEQPETTAVLAPAQMSSGPVIVRYENGQLTIQALNIPLMSVLQAVSRQIGVIIDAPLEADEPVMGLFGPGSPRAVLGALLDGSHFNYVMTSSVTDRNILARVVLTARPDAPGKSSREEKAQQPTPPPLSDTQVARTEGVPAASTLSPEQLRGQVKELLQQAAAEDAGTENTEGDSSGFAQLQALMEATLAKAAALASIDKAIEANSTKTALQTGSARPEGSGVDPAGENVPTSRVRHRRR